MKKTAVIFVLLLSAIHVHAANKVRFRISQPLCVLTFLQAANGNHDMSVTLQDYIWSHVPRGDSAKLSGLVHELSSIPLDYSYMPPDYPEARQKPRNILNLITIAAVQSSSIDDFMARIIGIMPNEDWVRLKRVMTAAEPYYSNMMATPYNAALHKELGALEKYSDRVEAIFNKLKHFYGSTWNDDIPFTVSIYPVPGNKGGTTATPHSNSLVLAVLTEEKDHVMSMGITVHEICHVLYEEQPLALQQQLDSAFLQNTSAWNKYAYYYIDEALATACGNGWTYKTIAGRMDTSSWYNDAYINGFAHAIYPVVEEYITAGKLIDKAFVDRAITLFAQQFPDAIYNYTNLLNRIHLYTDADDMAQFGQVDATLRKYFRITSCYSSYPIADTQVPDMVSKADDTQLFLVYTHHEDNYKALHKMFPQMGDAAPGQEGIISFIDEKKRPVIIVNAHNQDRLNNALLMLAKSKKMDPAKQFTPLD